MSLHALAGHMATKGRGGDSMLVHMTPEEVQSLQAMALRGGGSLTINPETGLPEANFLKKMLPMIAGAALNFFAPGLGTAVGGMFGLGAAAGTGLAVGGISALATGSLSRGLMAGLGAYGGASLAGGLAGAGEGAIAAGDIAAQQAAGTFPTLAEGASQEAIAQYAADVNALRDTALSTAKDAGFGAKMSAGLGQIANNPGMYAKDMLMSGYAAMSPMMAADSVQTTTQRPDTGMIRNYTFDPYGQTYTSAGNYPASEYKGMAQGGIVALAAGGFTDAQVASYIQNNNLSGQGLQDAAAVFGLNADQLGRAQALISNKDASIQAASDAYNTAVAGRPDLVEQNLGFYNPATKTGSGWEDVVTDRYIQDQPNATYAQIAAAKQGSGVTNEDLARSFDRFGYSDALYHVTTAPDWKNELGLTGFAGLSSNINAYVDKANALNMTPAEKRARAYDDMINSGMNMKDVVRATGKTIEELFPDTKTKVVTTTGTTGNTQGTGTQGGINDLTNVGSDRLFSGVSGISGAGQVGGGTVVNPNGTITTSPRIPGIPVGGFTGMQNLRDVYTDRGGSLGYVNDAPTTMDEFDQRFNTQKNDSLAAYNYLVGKGANNNAYPTKSGVEQIMRPYSEVTTGIPAAEGRPTQKYIFQNGKYVENPNYRPLSYNSMGERVVGLTSSEVIKGITPFKDGKNDAGLFDFVSQNNISEAQLAAALGISIAEARARLAAAKKTSTAATNANVQTDNSGYGDGNTTAPPPGVEGVATDSPDGVTNAASGGRVRRMALGGLGALAGGGSASQYNLGSYSDGGRLLRGPGDGVSDSIPATIGNKQPARLADGEFVVPARIVSELGNGSTEAGARKLYAMMDRVQKARGKTTGKNRVAANTRSDKYLPA